LRSLRDSLQALRAPTPLLGCLPSGRLAPPKPGAERADRRQADTVYQCPMCDVRLIGEQYCEECHSFARRLGPGGNCPCCDEPISITELLQPEQFAARKGQKTTRGR